MNDLFLPRKSLLVIAKARKGPMAIKKESLLILVARQKGLAVAVAELEELF